jgi:hypothetical protein
MSTFEVTAVRTARQPGYAHEHITHVGIGSRQWLLPRETVIRDLRSPYGDRYYTYANGTRADVIVAGCPACGFGDYITTTPDWTTENNLLSLPRI